MWPIQQGSSESRVEPDIQSPTESLLLVGRGRSDPRIERIASEPRLGLESLWSRSSRALNVAVLASENEGISLVEVVEEVNPGFNGCLTYRFMCMRGIKQGKLVGM